MLVDADPVSAARLAELDLLLLGSDRTLLDGCSFVALGRLSEEGTGEALACDEPFRGERVALALVDGPTDEPVEGDPSTRLFLTAFTLTTGNPSPSLARLLDDPDAGSLESRFTSARSGDPTDFNF